MKFDCWIKSHFIENIEANTEEDAKRKFIELIRDNLSIDNVDAIEVDNESEDRK